jgi:hypothetical protein
MEMFEALTPIHEAPNISYQRKIDNVIRICDGVAKGKAQIFQNQKTRLAYLNMWRDLYVAYGSVQSRINLYSTGLESVQPADTTVAAMSSYAGHLVSLTTCLNAVDEVENHNTNWRKAWTQLLSHDPARFQTYADKLPGWIKVYNLCERTYIRDNPGPKLIEYKDYLYRLETAEQNRAIKYTVMRASVQAPASKPEERVAEAHASGNKRPRHEMTRNDGERQETCIVDGKSHTLRECPIITVAERKKFFAEANRCYRCGTPGHRVVECWSKKSCGRCFAAGKRGAPADHHIALCPMFEKLRLGHPEANQGGGQKASSSEPPQKRTKNDAQAPSGSGKNSGWKGKYKKGNHFQKKNGMASGQQEKRPDEANLLSQLALFLQKQTPAVGNPTPAGTGAQSDTK